VVYGRAYPARGRGHEVKESATVSSTADAAGEQDLAARLGFEREQVVQEYGYDDDVDLDLRESIEDLTGNELVDEDAQEVVDGVILWWREGDGDLTDALMDVPGSLAEGGPIWLLTPKSGRDGHVPPSDVEEAAPTAGLHVTRSMPVGPDWTATRLVSPKGSRRS
jgi:hypothetical protein